MSQAEISEDQKILLKNLIIEFEDIFAKHKMDVGLLKDFPCKIDLVDNTPVRTSYRPALHYRREALRNILDRMLNANIIQHSDSDYCSQTLLVPKKDGTFRMVTDLRELNKKIAQQPAILPRIDSAIDCLNGNKSFSSIDLNAAYYHVPLEENSKIYTAFAALDDLYEYNGYKYCTRSLFGNYEANFKRISFDIEYRPGKK